MKIPVRWVAALCVFLASIMPPLMAEEKQNQTESGSTTISSFTADYPQNRAGIFIQGPDWIQIQAATPSKTSVKRGVASSFSYGAIPAAVVARYDGLHAPAQVGTGRVTICICHLLSLPGPPLIVKLKAKKDFRELDGGRVHILAAKMAEAGQNDLVPIDVAQPESNVWQVRPQQPLPAGEYALMLGAQNMAIFPFTVSDSGAVSSTPDKH